MSDTKYFTEEGLKKIRAEIEYLSTVERPKISIQISEARDKGDLSENAEYDAAKEAQGLLELKISKLQESLQHGRIIDESKMDSSKVYLLSTVTIKNTKNNSTMKYTLVPEEESDLKKGKISVFGFGGASNITGIQDDSATTNPNYKRQVAQTTGAKTGAVGIKHVHFLGAQTRIISDLVLSTSRPFI